jgi:hypothetical protein
MVDDFETVNGVQIREVKQTRDKPKIEDKQFEIEYLDNVYLHRLVCFQLFHANVMVGRGKTKQFNGLQKMFVVMDTKDEFIKGRKQYGEVACMVYEKIADYLVKKYNYNPVAMILMDSVDSFEKVK